ncbi:MAG: 50S ribosomal protein L19e [Candidatus Aenigmatarchaeota archaeon]
MKIPTSKKRIAAKLLKTGVSKVKILDDKAVEEAITREDFKRLIAKGVIVKEPKRGTSRKYANYKLEQKKRGRRIRKGSRKGKKHAKEDRKTKWIKRVRPLRRFLKQLRNENRIEKKEYRKLYNMVKGGSFRSKKHLIYYLKSKDIIKSKVGKNEKKT